MNIGNGKTQISDGSDALGKWIIKSKASGDIILDEGNSLASRYVVISTDPFATGTETRIEYDSPQISMPFRVLVGLSRSVPTVGTEFSTEFVSNSSVAEPEPVAIASMSQSTTTLTVNTTSNHNLRAGQSVCIAGADNSRFNYPSIVVASTPTPTQFTVTSGPFGTINSFTASASGTMGAVYNRPRIGYAQDGSSMIFENTSATNASFYVRSESGEVYPSGTAAGNHSVNIATTNSLIPITSPGSYCFQPTTVYSFITDSETLQWCDKAVDSSSQNFTIRLKREQVLPNPFEKYKIRIRANRTHSVPVPIAEIISIAKSGSTTATVTTAAAHGLTTSDLITIYGVRDQTNFPNLTGASTILSVPTETTFTVIIGTSSTTNSRGGYISRVQGNITQQGAIAQVLSTASRTSNIVTIIGSASWSGISIGDFINIYGARNVTDGDSIGIDGPWRINNINGTTLVLDAITGSQTGTDFTVVNCGGGVIKRSDIRIHFIRAITYDRLVVESYGGMARGLDQSTATGVAVVGITATSLTQINGVTAAASAVTTNRALAVTYGGAAVNNDVTSSARTGSGNSGTISDDIGGSCSAVLSVTASSGTNRTLDVSLEESYDNGTTWIVVYHFERFTTSVGTAFMPPVPIGGRIRWVWVLGGTSPSFTFTITRMRVATTFPLFRQYFDRTSDLLNGTAAATSSAFFVSGCKTLNARISLGSAVTPAYYMFQVSDDNSTWSSLTTSNTVSIINNIVTISLTNSCSRFARLLCSSPGSSQVGNYVSVTGTA